MDVPLTAEEAYMAGIGDFATARAQAIELCIQYDTPKRFDELFRNAVTALYQARLESGQLPPLYENPYAEKAI